MAVRYFENIYGNYLSFTPYMQDMRFPHWAINDLCTVEYDAVSLG